MYTCAYQHNLLLNNFIKRTAVIRKALEQVVANAACHSYDAQASLRYYGMLSSAWTFQDGTFGNDSNST